MTTLSWNELPGGGELASGDDCTYLIISEKGSMTLTRYRTEYHGPGRFGREADAAAVARQVILNAIQVQFATGVFPETDGAISTRLREAAQQYESGLGVTGKPAWQHGHDTTTTQDRRQP